METLEAESGCCFRCPTEVYPASASAQASRLQNPWPELAANPLEIARSQPVLNTIYCPLPPIEPEELEDHTNAKEVFTRLHEYIHFYYLSRTPAKDLLRVLLALSYETVDTLLSANVPAVSRTKVWENFLNYNQKISNLVERIEFVEELLACALPIEILKIGIRDEGLWHSNKHVAENLADLVAQVMNEQEKKFPGFVATWVRSLPMFLRLRPAPYGNDKHIIIPYLQTIAVDEAGDGFPYAVDARKNLNLNLDLMYYIHKRPKHGKESIERLHAENEKGINALVAVVAHREKELGNSSSFSTFLVELLKINQCTLGSQKGISLWQQPLWDAMPGIIAYLSPNDQKSIKVQIAQAANLGTAEYGQAADALLSLLFYEGIRQQLSSRKGLVCPSQESTGRCRCSPEDRALLEQLYHLAKDRLFAKHEVQKWRPLPCRY